MFPVCSTWNSQKNTNVDHPHPGDGGALTEAETTGRERRWSGVGWRRRSERETMGYRRRTMEDRDSREPETDTPKIEDTEDEWPDVRGQGKRQEWGLFPSETNPDDTTPGYTCPRGPPTSHRSTVAPTSAGTRSFPAEPRMRGMTRKESSIFLDAFNFSK